MTPFDPNWPHGHRLRDGRKAELRGTVYDGRKIQHLAVITNVDGSQWYKSWPEDGCVDKRPDPCDLLNAPAPKRTWEVVAVELSGTGGVVVFRPADCSGYENARIIGRYTLTEGEGMEEKDG